MNDSEQINQNRVIRIFISSTFRDMMQERDLLVKEVFPELRRKCAKRFVTFTEVDLRWGITEAQANEGQVLPLCLAEIERSRPYFIGLLGERYGWIPDTIRPEVIAREPWLREHVQGRTSVTELEILHGVLNNPQMQSHAFFYFRDPTYVNDSTLTDDERRDMVERDIPADVERYGPAEATRRKEERKAKLDALKQRIRDSKLPLAEPYPSPKTLARLVRRQFNRLIDRLYPEDQTPDPLTQERLMHEAHAKNKLFACIGRPAHLAALTAFAELPDHGGKGLVVTGESGGGKTALLAAWARDWAKNQAEDFLFQHYLGATAGSVSPEGFLRRLLGELKRRFGIPDDIPTDPEKLRDALPVWLAQTIGKGRIVLVIDGLNQVQGSEPDRHLLFLPRHFPPHVVVIASTLPGPALDALRERGWAEHDLPRASEVEVDAMVGEYLKIHARTLEPVLRHELVTAPGTKNPLFLRTILEELRQFGSFQQLPQRVRHYLEADNPKNLFLRVMTRWQEDFDGKYPEQDKPKFDLVRRSLTYLWAARQGLSESEWLDLLGMPSPTSDLGPLTSDPLPRALWTPLFLALEPHLSQRDGLFAFGHDFLRQAVETAFVPSDDLQQAAHLTLADYFERHEHQQEMTPRKATEWPYQLHAAKTWDRLEACLTDIPLFIALYIGKTKWELTAYWHPLRRSGRDMGRCYTGAYERWIAVLANTDDHDVNTQIGLFLEENGLQAAAEPLLKQALETRERVLGPDHPDTLRSVNNLGALLRIRGDYAGAERLLKRALETRERVLGPNHPDTLMSVVDLGMLLWDRGDREGAQPLLYRALTDRERVLGPEHPDTLSSMSIMSSFVKTEPSWGGRCRERDDTWRGESLERRAYEIRKRVLGPDHPDTLWSMQNTASTLSRQGDEAGAELLYRRTLEAKERVMGPDHPDTLGSLECLAGFLTNRGDYAGAEPLFRRAVEGHERAWGPEHRSTLRSVDHLADLLDRKGDYAGAGVLCYRALAARERLLGPKHPNTRERASELGKLLMKMGNCAGAEPLYRQALEVFERILGPEHPYTLGILRRLATLLTSRGDYAGAEPLYRRALEASERVSGPEHLDTLGTVSDLAKLLLSKGDYANAGRLFRRVLEARERILGMNAPDTLETVNNLANLQAEKEDYAGADLLFRRAIEGVLEVSARKHRPHNPNLQTFIVNYTHCLEKQGRSPESIRDTLDAIVRPFQTTKMRITGEFVGHFKKGMWYRFLVTHPDGMDAGRCAEMSKCLSTLGGKITIRRDQETVKSFGIMDLMMLAARFGSILEFNFDADVVSQRLVSLRQIGIFLPENCQATFECLRCHETSTVAVGELCQGCECPRCGYRSVVGLVECTATE